MTPRSLPSGWSEAEASLWGWHAVGSKRKGPGGTCWPQVTKQPPAKGTAGGPLLLGTLSLKPVWSEQERSCSLSALTRRRHQLQAVTRDTGLETCDASPPVSPWRRLGRALTAASSAVAWGADPRETRAGLSPGGWVSARPLIAARGPRPADFLKRERTENHPQNRWKLQIPGPCSPRCCYIGPGVRPGNLYF